MKTNYYPDLNCHQVTLQRLAAAALTLTCVGMAAPVMLKAATDTALCNSNTADGTGALAVVCSGTNDGFGNTAVGYNAQASNISGDLNVAVGIAALYSNVVSNNNTAIGANALLRFYDPDGAYYPDSDNTAVGYNTLVNCTSAKDTAIGAYALYNNTIGDNNSALGYAALYGNTTGYNNTASGSQALYANTTGTYNSALGRTALFQNTTGYWNTASGAEALYDNGTGNSNTAIGAFTLNTNLTGSFNTAVGTSALASSTGSSNTAVGWDALSSSTGGSNIALGESAGINLTTGSNNIDIGNKGVAGESNTIRIGKKGTQTATFIAGIRGTTVAGGIAVLVDANGRLGTTTSSARFKDSIRPMDRTSEAILSLQPVTFHYTKELDPNGIRQFGLVAEEVAKVNPDLIVRDEQGKPYTVRYDAVNAMLLNEFLKEHHTVQKQEVTISELKSTVARQEKEFLSAIAQQQKQIEALSTNLHKVSAQLEMTRPASRMVANDQ